MSFLANKISPTTITFNTEDVSTVYFQNTAFMTEPVLVWSKWIGWDRAGWREIYNLCKMKQAGIIKDWPEDIKIGSTKIITRWKGVGQTHDRAVVELIGIDLDGPGVLTFMSKYSNSISTYMENEENDYEDMYEWDSIYHADGSVSIDDTITYMVDIIKPLRKQWYNATDGKVEVSELLFWDLSYAEAGLESEYPCFTEGVSTPYFTAPPIRYTSGGYPPDQVQYGSRNYICWGNGDDRTYEFNPDYTFGVNTGTATGIYTMACFAIG